MQEVNFSELNQLKKQEFFDYLISNNIHFKEGDSNYYAKVLVKSQKTNLKIKVPTHKNKENLVPKPHRQQPIQHTHTRNHIHKQKQKQLPQRMSTPTRTHSSIVGRRKQELSLSDCSLDLSDVKGQKSARIRAQRDETPKNKSICIPANQPEKPKPRLGQREKERESVKSREERPKTSIRPGQSKQKDHRSLNKCQISRAQQKLSPYLRIFRINTILSRPSRWPRHQLDKAIEEIYTANFSKNSSILKSRKLKQTLQKQYVFASFILQFYQQKFRAKKTTEYNVVGLVNSLLVNLEQERPRNLMIFSKFMMEDYEYEDLIFFLFVRSLAEKQFKQAQTLSDKRGRNEEEEFKFFMTRKEMVKLVKTLVGKDTSLAEEYVSLISQHMTVGTIAIYEILEILVDNFSKRRHSQSVDLHPHPRSSLPITSPKQSFLTVPTPHQDPEYIQISIESRMQELTFGEFSSRSHYDTNNDNTDVFWYQTNQKAQPPSDHLQVSIVQKMDSKISEMIKYILDDDEEFRLTISQFHGLIFNKARNLIRAVFDMDKMRWFRLLNIRQPEGAKLLHIEGLQKMLRSLRSECTSAALNKFCKCILTTEEFLEAIEKIVIG